MTKRISELTPSDQLESLDLVEVSQNTDSESPNYISSRVFSWQFNPYRFNVKGDDVITLNESGDYDFTITIPQSDLVRINSDLDPLASILDYSIEGAVNFNIPSFSNDAKYIMWFKIFYSSGAKWAEFNSANNVQGTQVSLPNINNTTPRVYVRDTNYDSNGLNINIGFSLNSEEPVSMNLNYHGYLDINYSAFFGV